jgi:hypothetical protein
VLKGTNLNKKLNKMTTLQVINFAARVQVGDILVSGRQEMRVESITSDAFKGQAIYKGKDRGTSFLSFSTLMNPHAGLITIK